MKIHKEGYITISLILFVLLILNAILYYFVLPQIPWLFYVFVFLSTSFWGFIISFFRVPKRNQTFDEKSIISPADGKVVVIEKNIDEEYFKNERIQISVFMSPLNVHQNLSPVSGTITYNKYHKGKYIVAMHPKSSTLNERHSIVIKMKNGAEILVKQIAGAVARRIVNYSKKDTTIKQNEEFGFIKFGSRVDILLPTDAIIKAQIGQNVKGGVTVLAEIKEKK